VAGEHILVIDDSPTITKVVQLVLSKGGYRVTAAADGEDGLAAARAERPDLILLDFVMPRMNGYQFCRELAADAALRDIPVVLMSAKGDQVGERFVKVMGIVDYITKPFSPEAISAVVQHTVAKYRPGGEETTATGGAGAKQAALEAAHAAALTGALATLRARLASLGEAPSDDQLRALVDGLDVDALGGGSGLGLRGDLHIVPLAEVLHLLDSQEQTGVLRVTRPASGEVAIYFRRGRVEQALGHGVGDEFQIGRFVIDAEFMKVDELDAFLGSRAAPPDPALLGEALVAAGCIVDADLKIALARQSSELIYEVLRWRTGRFWFTAGSEPPPPVRAAQLQLDVEAILMEGYRRVDEWHLIERVVDDFDVVYLRNEDAVAQMGRGRLTREELGILELVNGKNSVKEIIRKSRLGSFEVSKMLYRLLSIKLVRRRVLPVAV
jgi:CheY-like chemotaxis protein